jgi:hypothetical protein
MSHHTASVIASLAAAAHASFDMATALAWLPMSAAPRNGDWIVALGIDAAQVFRIGWGRDEAQPLSWATINSTYGEAFFLGWIPCPQDPPSWRSSPPVGDTAGVELGLAPAGHPADADPEIADSTWLGG